MGDSLTPETSGAPAASTIPDTPAPAPDAAAVPTPPAGEAPPPPPAPPAPDPKLTSRYVELSRREKELVQREKAAKDAGAAASTFEAAKAKVRENPLEALSLLGVDLDTLVRRIAEPDKPETIEEKVARLEKDRTADKAAADAAAKAQLDRAERDAVAGFVGRIKEELTGDDYELVNASDAHELVYTVIGEHWETTGGERGGEIMTIAEAGKLVEDHLLEEATARLKGSKKLQARLAPAAPPPPPPPPPRSRLLGSLAEQKLAAVPPAAAPAPPPIAEESREDAIARIAKKYLVKRPA